MTDNRIKDLVYKVKRETENKKLEWVKSSYPNSYRLSLGSGMIVLDYTLTDIDQSLYTFSVFNDRNIIIDSITVVNSDDMFDELKQLYALAENRYLKKDDTYKSMFDALDLPF